MNKVILEFIFVVLLMACTGKKNNEYHVTESEMTKIIVYGSLDCDHCMEFTQALDSLNIPYDFREVDKDDQQFTDMYNKIKKINYQGYVSYPVVDMNSNIYVNPSIKLIINILNDLD